MPQSGSDFTIRSVPLHKSPWGSNDLPQVAHADDTSLAAKLRAAMIAAEFVYRGEPSQRALAKRIAGPDATDRQVDGWRKQVRRWLDTTQPQQTIRRDTAALLSDVLGVPIDYWPTEREPSLTGRLEAAEKALRSLKRPLTDEERERAQSLLEELEQLRSILRESAGE